MANIKKIKIGSTEYDIKDAVSGYITGINSSDVTTALGYTPYDASNPNGYTSNVGTVTSVNNVSPVSGNVTLSIPVVDQSYDGTSTNAQSGVAVKSAIDSAISSVYKPAGSVAFASLPALSSSIEGYVYNITDAFTTTSDFVEGAGKSYPAGTNIVCIDVSGTYKWDVLSGIVDLSGYVPTSRTINSKALTSDITLSASDVGALPDSTVIPTLNSTTNVLPVRNSASSLTDSQFKQTADGRSIGVFGEPDASTSYDKYFSIKGGRLRTYAGGENSYLFQGYTNGGANSAMIAAIMSGNNDAGAYMTFGCCNGTNSWIGSGVKNSFFFSSQKNSGGQALKPLKFIVDEYCSGTPQIVIATNKKVGIKTENPSYDLDVSGTINASTDIKVNGTSVLTGITSSDVTTALGYTPYDASNPSGYTSNVGTVTSVNNTSPDGSGNVTLSIPTVNDSTITIQKNGTTVDSFTTNASSNKSINITVPTSAADVSALPSSTKYGADLSYSSNTLQLKDQDGNNLGSAVTISGGGSLPSQTGQSGKFLTTDGTDASWGRVKTNDLFDSKWTDYLLNDQSWLRADTFSWQDGTVYSDAYQHLVDDIDGKTATTETVDGTTVTYYLADDGHKIVDVADVSAIETVYSSTGVAWYYVLDTANTRFKLPRENPLYEELRQQNKVPVIGGTAETGNINYAISSGTNPPTISANDPIYIGTGSTSSSTYRNMMGSKKTGTATIIPMVVDLSAETSVYKGNKYLYFYVGNFSQSATEQTAGLNSELFNGKADTDLNNVSAGIDFVVESYQNGTNWYRLYKSGWVEQGGIANNMASGIASVTFLKQFSNTDYTCVGNAAQTGTGFYQSNPVNIINKTVSSMDLRVYNNTNHPLCWEAKGMSAQS